MSPSEAAVTRVADDDEVCNNRRAAGDAPEKTMKQQEFTHHDNDQFEYETTLYSMLMVE